VDTTASHSSWSLRDQACIWHPFTQAQTAAPPIPIVRGKGSYLYTEEGDAYLDAISSWWVNIHGHAHPYIAEKIGAQADALEHILFAGFTHPQAVILAERLLAILPKGYSRVFYSDNGSTAVETALKMVFQASCNGKKLLSFEGGYHGDTFGAMSAGGKSFCNRPFWPYLFEIDSIPPPLFGKESESLEAFEKAVVSGEITAFIFEPLIQGWGGMMRIHSGQMLDQMIRRCKELGILTIADEVMTGFGRTGPLFACSYLETTPDIICLSKGITGGFLPLGATIAKEPLFEAFLGPNLSQALLHGHTFTANPLACAAANASLDLLLQPECTQSRMMIEEEHRFFQQKCKGHPKLLRCDFLGTILALEYKTHESSYYNPMRDQLIEFFQARGILIRPFGNVLYLLPPYCITREELRTIYSAIAVTLETF
jgi:adenosylmethionine-8-amino-7-oxononanoate aminotransferase